MYSAVVQRRTVKCSEGDSRSCVQLFVHVSQLFHTHEYAYEDVRCATEPNAKVILQQFQNESDKTDTIPFAEPFSSYFSIVITQALMCTLTFQIVIVG